MSAAAVAFSAMAQSSFSSCSSSAFFPARFLASRTPCISSPRFRPQIRAVSAPEDCNQEECAPEKEVGKVSMEWVTEEKTKVTGTYPPLNKKKWTGYVEKDTAGQTNIYSVEPAVYISESAISSGTAGDSSEGSEQTVAAAVGLALGLIFGAGIVLQKVGNNMPVESNVAYSGPSLSFYVQKFKSSAVEVEAPAPELTIIPVLGSELSSTDSDASSSTVDAQTTFAPYDATAIQAVDEVAAQ